MLAIFATNWPAPKVATDRQAPLRRRNDVLSQVPFHGATLVGEEVVTVQISPNPMPRPPVSLPQHGAARLTCPQCHTTQDVWVAPLHQGTEALKVRCPCGAVFSVRRHEQPAGGAHA